MATNLISLIMQSLTPDMIAKIASTLGLDSGTAQKAIGAAVPALLAAFAGTAAKPDGPRKLLDAVGQQDPGVLNNLAKTLDGSGHEALAQQGSGLLNSLLGRSTQTGLAGAVSKYAGLDEKTSSSLLGLLGPVVAGTLRKEQNASGLDASGLAKLLASQKSNVTAALPPGFANLLGDTGVLDNVGERAASAARTTAAKAQQATERARSSANWMAWLIPLVALVGLAWYFFVLQPTKTVEPPVTTTEQPATTTTEQPATNAAQSLVVDGVDLGASVTSAIDGLKSSLGSITDASTAQAALPKLQEATAALDKVSGAAGKLSAGQKTALAGLITAALPVINPLFDKVLAIPGVSDIAKPAIDGLRAKLDALAKA